jgi:hypothetical protein
VTDLEIDPFRLERKPRSGAAHPAPPRRQEFWVAQGSGPEATLDWKVRDGSYRLVLMNADASRAVRVSGDVALTLPHLSRVAWVLVGAGVLAMMGGLGLAVAQLRRT